MNKKSSKSNVGSHCKSSTKTLQNFEDTIRTELEKGFGPVPSSVSNFDKEWMVEVGKASYFCRDGRFDMYDAVFPFLQTVMIDRNIVHTYY